MNSATVLDVEKVSYFYGSRAPVLHEVTFFVNAGEIVGLVGPNGSGKSTLIKLVFNLLQLKEGSIRINGNSHQAKATRVQAQYLASNDHIPEFPRASEYLQLAADLYHENLDASEAESFFESYGMPNRLHDLMEDYSHGMRKKVQLISAFLMRRPLTVIDETLNGIDIEALHLVEKELLSMRSQGRGILLCTHDFPMLERVADRVIFIDYGHIISNMSIRSLRQTGSTLEELVLSHLDGRS